MKKHLIVLVILALSLPFIQGQKGCAGGAISMDEGPQDVVQAEALGEQASLQEPAEIEPMIDFGQIGPSGIMTPTPEEYEEKKAEEPSEGRIDCGALIPDRAVLKARVDFGILEQVSMDSAVIDRFESQVNFLIDALELDFSARDMLSKLDNVCVACVMDIASSASPWAPSQCDEIVAVSVFKDDFIISQNVSQDFMLNESGFYKVKGEKVAAQVSPQVIAIGSEKIVSDVANVKPVENLFISQKKFFEPAALFFQVAGPLADNVIEHNMFTAFKALPQVIEYINVGDAAKVHYLGAIDFLNPAISAAIYEDNVIKIKMAIAADYEVFLGMLQSYSKAAAAAPIQRIKADALKAPSEGEDIAALEKQIREYEALISDLQVRKADIKSKMESAQNRVDVAKLKAEMDKVDRMIAEYEAQIAELKKQIEARG